MYLKSNSTFKCSYQTIVDRLEFEGAFSIRKFMYKIFNIVFEVEKKKIAHLH